MLHGIQDDCAFNQMRELDGKKAKQTKVVLGIDKRYNSWKEKEHSHFSNTTANQFKFKFYGWLCC